MSTLINAYCTVQQPPALNFAHELKARRDRSDADLDRHLQDFAGYVFEQAGGVMTQSLFHVLAHIRRVQHHLSVAVDKGALDAFANWAARANAICFLPDGSVRAPDGRALVLPGGEAPEADAQLPYPEDAWERKRHSDARLRELGVSVPVSLPPVIGETELRLRPARDVALRAAALFVVALRGESLAGQDPIEEETLRTRFPEGAAALSPKEAEFLADASPTEQAIVNAVWRYEACALLLFSLNHRSELPWPTSVCNVSDLASCVLELEPDWVEKAALRPAAEILDALDLHFRLHWAARHAHLNQKPPPADLDSGVIVERHHTLNWLVRFQDEAWDDVATPT